ncbi:MAG TPA: thiamine phosphate synthase [bacterium]|nr:thiamine phosphate synthase [bacterium]HOL66755.1 thiamine phosphate synthase [bacterium]HPP11528.1 thiamine phosphate synthase [bacterium]
MSQALRIIDADFNRAREALRTAEDGVRFLLNDRKLTYQIKRLRHDLSKVLLTHFQPEQLSRYRESEQDAGRHDDFRSESCPPPEIIRRNLRRAGEALRTLEEYARSFSGKLSGEMHNLRFQLYRIEREVTLLLARPRLPRPCLCVVLNLTEQALFKQLALRVARAGPEMVQIRYKGEDVPFFLEMSRWLRERLTRETLLVINDRPDVCLAVGAAGVHLGQKDLPADLARRLLPEKLVGISCQTLPQLHQAARNGADYAGIGPVFPTPVKPEKTALGVKRLTALVKRSKIPVIAIGGITETNIEQVVETGVSGIAVISAVAHSACPERTIQRMKKVMHCFCPPIQHE